MLTALSLADFRNFENFSLPTIPQVTVLIGPNGTGKTNVLEAVALLGGIPLRRKSRPADMIRWGEPLAVVEGSIHTDNEESVRMVIQSGRIQYVLNSNVVTTAQVAGLLPSIIFAPETVQLFVGDPGNRRAVLDRILIAMFPDYYDAHTHYMRVLKQRNAALRQGYVSQLGVWEEELARHAAVIMLYRHWLLGQLQTNMELPVHITYLASPRKVLPLLSETDDVRQLVRESAEKIREFLQDKWATLRKKEIAVGFSLMGPQRDDWYLEAVFNGSGKYINVGTYASRGQQRLVVIHVQHAALKLLSRETGQTPLWLLDDVFSELDEDHQHKIVSLGDTYQMFITTTNKNYAGIQHLMSESDVLIIPLAR